ncbi:putative membrane protein [Campylobacter blaseri]|uniref:Copper resistance protein CopD n=1 Tax=Campylobacter blaseri TaxID=2042961 RepID=A0A2P8R1G6_9BACT|nr:copper resistance protein CopD [Campylobacter blaseri]PSM52339.1 copper resistance protein CopD [Campylobacter blaseri]PSM54105.1 copper resistance protein CopD [Campylobacter blaseri]QKF85548.1 putative membrane protein [Campylobacter blaseri]
MSSIYPYTQIVHLFASVIFVGYLFFDVVILTMAKKNLSKESINTTDNAINSVSVKIMPACFLILVLSGGMMMSTWVGSKSGGYFTSDLQTLLVIKATLALILLIVIITNLVSKYILKKKGIFGNIHLFALITSAIIIFLAKYMFIA